MTDVDAKAHISASMVLIKNAIRSITDPTTAELAFREMNRACHGLVPKFRRAHTLVTQIVPDTQLTLWQDFANGLKMNTDNG